MSTNEPAQLLKKLFSELAKETWAVHKVKYDVMALFGVKMNGSLN